MKTLNQLTADYERLEREGARLAGETTDLSQRATVYHHLYEHSRGNHTFPLIAAHGALWAGNYFRFGMRVGRIATLQFGFHDAQRRGAMERLEQFAEAFRDINRRVCIDVYTKYHFTDIHGDHPLVRQFVDRPLLRALKSVHAARRGDCELSEAEKREAFEAHFLNEQDTVVEPRIREATAELQWPLIQAIALRPLIRFAYFPRMTRFSFRNFASKEERIAKGFRAFEVASQVGWSHVAQSLRAYDVLPVKFFADPASHFAEVRAAVLA